MSANVEQQKAMTVLAAELEQALPQGGELDAARAHALLGGPVGKVIDLIAALRAGDNQTAWKLFKELGDMLLGVGTAGTAGGGGISFAPQQSGLFQNFNWGNLLAILAKVLPLILSSGASA